MEFSRLNGYDVKHKKAVRFYDTVALMKADNTLKAGMHIKTKGYYAINDGGGCDYVIGTISNTELIDEMFIIGLNNNLVANLQTKDILNIKQIGAKSENNFDNTPYFTKALESNYKTLFVPSGTYEVGQFDIDGYTLKGENDSILKCNTNVDKWINIKNKIFIDGITFDGNSKANKIYMVNDSGSSVGKSISNCIFCNMVNTGLEVFSIDTTISKCSFHHNGIGLLITNVGNFIDSCYSFMNRDDGFKVTVGTNALTNCKSYGNVYYGFNLPGSYITLSNCESQQNRRGSIKLDEGSNHNIITNFNVIGECAIRRNATDLAQYPIIKLAGTNHYIQASVRPFHFYHYPDTENTEDWIAYPSCLIECTKSPTNNLILHPTNCHVEIKTIINTNAKETAETVFPTLSYIPIITSFNQGQSNKILIDDIEYKNYIYPEYSTNNFSERSKRLGTDKKDFMISVNTTTLNNLAVSNNDYIVYQSTETINDENDLKLYFGGIAYPINYRGYFKTFATINMIGRVNGDYVQAYGNPTLNERVVALDGIEDVNKNYMNYCINAKRFITSLDGYEPGSLKILVKIHLWKIKDITATEPLLIGCKNIALINDTGTKALEYE